MDWNIRSEPPNVTLSATLRNGLGCEYLHSVTHEPERNAATLRMVARQGLPPAELLEFQLDIVPNERADNPGQTIQFLRNLAEAVSLLLEADSSDAELRRSLRAEFGFLPD